MTNRNGTSQRAGWRISTVSGPFSEQPDEYNVRAVADLEPEIEGIVS